MLPSHGIFTVATSLIIHSCTCSSTPHKDTAEIKFLPCRTFQQNLWQLGFFSGKCSLGGGVEKKLLLLGEKFKTLGGEIPPSPTPQRPWKKKNPVGNKQSSWLLKGTEINHYDFKHPFSFTHLACKLAICAQMSAGTEQAAMTKMSKQSK